MEGGGLSESNPRLWWVASAMCKYGGGVDLDRCRVSCVRMRRDSSCSDVKRKSERESEAEIRVGV